MLVSPRLLHWENQLAPSQRAQNSQVPAPRTQDTPLVGRSGFSSRGGQGLLPKQTTDCGGSFVVSRHTKILILLCCFIWSRWAVFCRAAGRLLQGKLWEQLEEVQHWMAEMKDFSGRRESITTRSWSKKPAVVPWLRQLRADIALLSLYCHYRLSRHHYKKPSRVQPCCSCTSSCGVDMLCGADDNQRNDAWCQPSLPPPPPHPP